MSRSAEPRVGANVGCDLARVFFRWPEARNPAPNDSNEFCNPDLGVSSERPDTYRMAASKWDRTENGPKWLRPAWEAGLRHVEKGHG